ncbi:FliH/SctL family protein [Aestuariispira insulae]|uniref:Flagellar biosynthesis/type III secretory pathway protein FliH n=1 Tax=Aestuariispira insulae TaxID=1461337 RepID=A0A3D9HSG0_9PROT|nr:FliH/SctL family protein [Aestuariispira insulae]RED52424.1 flagellar biosynthesis/type III secretory pathway protein FliH [Aestuariispira insulae]
MAGGAFKYRPFTFDRSFDEAEIERARQAAIREQEAREEAERQAELERNPPPPTFSEEELEAAKTAAFQEGSSLGSQQALDGIEAQTLTALQTITGQLAVLHDRQALANESSFAQLAKITGDIFERLLPHYVKLHGSDEIIALVKECLEPLEDGGRVIIKVPADARDMLEEQLNQAAVESGFEGKLVVKPDPTLGPSDVKVDWGQGGTERKMEQTWGAIKEAIDRCVAHASGEYSIPEAEEISGPDTAQGETTHDAAPALEPGPATSMEMPVAEETAPSEMIDEPDARPTPETLETPDDPLPQQAQPPQEKMGPEEMDAEQMNPEMPEADLEEANRPDMTDPAAKVEE